MGAREDLIRRMMERRNSYGAPTSQYGNADVILGGGYPGYQDRFSPNPHSYQNFRQGLSEDMEDFEGESLIRQLDQEETMGNAMADGQPFDLGVELSDYEHDFDAEVAPVSMGNMTARGVPTEMPSYHGPDYGDAEGLQVSGMQDMTARGTALAQKNWLDHHKPENYDNAEEFKQQMYADGVVNPLYGNQTAEKLRGIYGGDIEPAQGDVVGRGMHAAATKKREINKEAFEKVLARFGGEMSKYNDWWHEQPEDERPTDYTQALQATAHMDTAQPSSWEGEGSVLSDNYVASVDEGSPEFVGPPLSGMGDDLPGGHHFAEAVGLGPLRAEVQRKLFGNYEGPPVRPELIDPEAWPGGYAPTPMATADAGQPEIQQGYQKAPPSAFTQDEWDEFSRHDAERSAEMAAEQPGFTGDEWDEFLRHESERAAEMAGQQQAGGETVTRPRYSRGKQARRRKRHEAFLAGRDKGGAMAGAPATQEEVPIPDIPSDAGYYSGMDAGGGYDVDPVGVGMPTLDQIVMGDRPSVRMPTLDQIVMGDRPSVRMPTIDQIQVGRTPGQGNEYDTMSMAPSDMMSQYADPAVDAAPNGLFSEETRTMSEIQSQVLTAQSSDANTNDSMGEKKVRKRRRSRGKQAYRRKQEEAAMDRLIRGSGMEFGPTAVDPSMVFGPPGPPVILGQPTIYEQNYDRRLGFNPLPPMQTESTKRPAWQYHLDRMLNKAGGGL